MSDEIRREVRREIRRIRLGTDRPVSCALCGIGELAVLKRASRRLVEFHHLAGEANDADLGVFLCLTHHAVCTELMRDGIPLDRATPRVLLERQVAILRGLAIFCSLAGPILDLLADAGSAQVEALDRTFPGWRDLEESR
jgi:hypothetical protein